MIIAVDYDKTLDFAGYPYVGKVDTNRVEKLKELKEKGHELILWTCRSGESLDIAVNYMKAYGLEFDAINKNLPRFSTELGYNSPKIIADLYIDDCAVNANKIDWSNLCENMF